MPKFLTDALQKLSKSTLAYLPEIKQHRDGIEFQNGWSLRLSNFNPLNPFYNAVHFSKWILSCASNLNPKYVLGAVTFAYQFTRVESGTIVSGFLLKDKTHFLQILPATGNYDGAPRLEDNHALAMNRAGGHKLGALSIKENLALATSRSFNLSYYPYYDLSNKHQLVQSYCTIKYISPGRYSPLHGTYADWFEYSRVLLYSINGTQSDYYFGSAINAICNLYRMSELEWRKESEWLMFALFGSEAVILIAIGLVYCFKTNRVENQNVRRNDIEADRPVERNQIERKPECPPERKIAQIVPQQNFENRLNQLKTQSQARPDLLEKIQQFEERYQCPISYSVMNNPVTLPTSHTYDLGPLLNWFRVGGKKCPTSNVEVSDTKNLKTSFKIKTWLEEDLNALEEKIGRELKNEKSVAEASYKCSRMYF